MSLLNKHQHFINKNYRNSKTSHDTDMKLWPLTKLNNRNTMTSNKSYKLRRHCCFSDFWLIWSNP